MNKIPEEKRVNALSLEDSDPDFEIISEQLHEAADFSVNMTRAHNESEFVSLLRNNVYDVILSDFRLPGFDGFGALRVRNEICPDVPFICVSGTIGEETSITLLKSGADDFVLKDRLKRLPFAVKNAIDEAQEKKTRLKTEERIRDSEIRYRRLFEAAQDGILIINAETGAITDANPYITDSLGYPLQELIGKRLWEIGAFADVKDSKAAFEELQQKEYIRYNDLPLKTKDGQSRYVEFVSNVYLVKGKKVIQCNIRDITERKHTEQLLQESEERLRATLETTKISIWDWDLKNDLWQTSPTFYTMLGNTPETNPKTREGSLQSFHPDDRAAINEKIKMVLNGTNSDYQYEARVKHADGSYRWHSVIGHTIERDERGKSTRLAGVRMDITERKLVEVKLRENEERLRLSLMASNQGLYDLNIQTGETIVNPEYALMLGYDPSTFIETLDGFMDRLHPDDKERIRLQLKDFIDGKIQVYRAEFRLHIRCGGWKWILSNGKIVEYSNENKPIRMLGTHTDIDILKKANEKIEEQAMLLNEAHDAIILLDMDHRILLWNKGAESMYGWSADEVMGKDIHTVLNDNAKLYEEPYEKLALNGQIIGEFVHKTKEMSEITVEERLSLVRDQQGNPKSILMINTNITERKQVESQLLRAQRLESIGTLASGIAHDLNNILGPILLSVQLLRMKVKDESLRNLIQTIEASAVRGKNIVAQVLGFARGAEIKPVEMQIRHIAVEVENVIKQTFDRNIEIQTYFPKSLWPINADPTQMHQVLMNLCVNARDAMPQGGKLTINAKNVEMNETQAALHAGANKGEYLEIEVRDTGFGIPADVVQKIFDPFFTTKEIGKGTGLGLSTVFGIVKQHQGFIVVDSIAGEGTTFRVFLPAIKMSGDIVEIPFRKDIERGNSESILVVDDEVSIQSVCRETLQFYNYTVTTANNGSEGISKFIQAESQYRVVLIDMMMPVMDGKTASAAIRKIDPTVKIIGMSGLIVESTMEAHDKIFDHFLQKPFTGKELMEAVQNILSKAN